MSRSILILFMLALGLGLFVWLIEMPAENKRAQVEKESQQLMSFKESDVQSLTIRSTAAEIVLTRNLAAPANSWTITQPRTMDADRQAIEDFLRTLILAKVSRVVDETGKDLSTYGLASPAMSVSVRLPSGNQTVLFGDSGPLSSTLYAKRDGEQKVLLTSLAGREILIKGLQDFRRKRVFEFDHSRVSRLKITHPEQTVVLYKEGHGEKAVWTIKAPIQAPADQPEVKSLLFALENLKAQAFVDDAQERHALHKEFKTPLVSITVHEDSPDTAATGKDRTINLFMTPTNVTNAYAETSSNDPLYRVPAAAAKDLAKDLFALRNKQLIASNAEQVKTLVINKEGDEYSLTHEGPEWLIDGDPGAKADAARVDVLLNRAFQLQAERIVTDKPGDLKVYGLAPPAAEFTASDAQGKVMGQLFVGRVENNLAFARGSALSGVFQIRPDILREIPKRGDLAKPAAR